MLSPLEATASSLVEATSPNSMLEGDRATSNAWLGTAMKAIAAREGVKQAHHICASRLKVGTSGVDTVYCVAAASGSLATIYSAAQSSAPTEAAISATTSAPRATSAAATIDSPNVKSLRSIPLADDAVSVRAAPGDVAGAFVVATTSTVRTFSLAASPQSSSGVTVVETGSWTSTAIERLGPICDIQVSPDCRYIGVSFQDAVVVLHRSSMLQTDCYAKPQLSKVAVIAPLEPVLVKIEHKVTSIDWQCSATAASFAGDSDTSCHASPPGVSDSPALLLVSHGDGAGATIYRESAPWSPVAFSRVGCLPPHSNGTGAETFGASFRNLLPSHRPKAECSDAVWMQHTIVHDRTHWSWSSHRSRHHSNTPSQGAAGATGTRFSSHSGHDSSPNEFLPPRPVIFTTSESRDSRSDGEDHRSASGIGTGSPAVTAGTTSRHVVPLPSMLGKHWATTAKGDTDGNAPNSLNSLSSSVGSNKTASSPAPTSLLDPSFKPFAWPSHGHRATAAGVGEAPAGSTDARVQKALQAMEQDAPSHACGTSSVDFAVTASVAGGSISLTLHRIMNATSGLGSATGAAGHDVAHCDVVHAVEIPPARLASVCSLASSSTITCSNVNIRSACTRHPARVAGSAAPTLMPLASGAAGATAGTVGADAGPTPGLSQQLRSLAFGGSLDCTGTGGSGDNQMRTRVASALATAAAYDAIDDEEDASVMYDGRPLHGAPGPGGEAGRMSAPCLRTSQRAGNRGMRTAARMREIPVSSRVMLGVELSDSLSSITVVKLLVEAHIHWSGGEVRLRVLNGPATVDAQPSTMPQRKSDSDRDAASAPITYPQHHPAFISACLKQGKLRLAELIFGHIALCTRRAVAWKRAVLDAKEKQEEAEVSARLAALSAASGGLSSSGDGQGSPVLLSPTNAFGTGSHFHDHSDGVEPFADCLKAGARLVVAVPQLPVSAVVAAARDDKFGPPSSAGTASTALTNDAEQDLPSVSLTALRRWYVTHPYCTAVVPTTEQVAHADTAKQPEADCTADEWGNTATSIPSTTSMYAPPLTVMDVAYLRDHVLGEAQAVVCGIGAPERQQLGWLLDAYCSLAGIAITPKQAPAAPATGQSPLVAAKNTLQGLDVPGSRALAAMRLFQAEQKQSSFVDVAGNASPSSPPQARSKAIGVSWSAVLAALHSDSQGDILRTLFPPEHPVTWGDLYSLRIPLWLRSDSDLAELVERVGKTVFLQSGRDPYSTVLPYLALGTSKLSLVRNFFRLSPSHSKVHSFLQNDFTTERWKAAASKNAFALLGAHRYEAAAGFFILSGKVGQAVKILVQQRKDPLMALAVARLAVYNGSVSIATAKVAGNYGGVDSQQLLKDVTAAILADAKAKQQQQQYQSAAAPQSHSSAVSRTVNAAHGGAAGGKPTHGFGFDDDADHDDAYVPASSSRPTIVFKDGMPVRVEHNEDGGDDDTVYRPGSSGATAQQQQLAPPTPSASSATDSNMRYSTRPNADDDPVAWVIDSEFAELCKPGGQPFGFDDETLSKQSSASSSSAMLIDAEQAAALSSIVSWVQKKPLDAVTGLFSACASTVGVVLGDAAVAEVALSLATQPTWKRAQMLKALRARVRSEGVPSSATDADWFEAVLVKLNEMAANALAAVGAPVLSITRPLPPNAEHNASYLRTVELAALQVYNTSLAAALDHETMIDTRSHLLHDCQETFFADVASTSSGRVTPSQLRADANALTRLATAAVDAQLWAAGMALALLCPTEAAARMAVSRTLNESHSIIKSALRSGAVTSIAAASAGGGLDRALPASHARMGLDLIRCCMLMSTHVMPQLASTGLAIMPVHAWLHLVLLASSTGQWDRVASLLHQRPAAFLATQREHAVDSSVRHDAAAAAKRMPAFVVDAVHSMWPHRWAVNVTSVDVDFATAVTFGSALRACADSPVCSPLAAQTSTSQQQNTTYSLEQWLDRYAANSFEALLSAAILDAMPASTSLDSSSSAGAGLRRDTQDNAAVSGDDVSAIVRAWYRRVAARVVAARVHIEVSAAPASSGDANRAVWSANTGPRSHIIAALTGAPESRPDHVPVALDWEAAQAREGAQTGDAPAGKGKLSGAKASSAAAPGATSHSRHDASAHHSKVKTPWWQDAEALLRPLVTNADSDQPMPAGDRSRADQALAACSDLWRWIGGPGLLWLIGTERRALARAKQRAMIGYLPDVRANNRVEIKPKSSAQPVLALLVLAASVGVGTAVMTTQRRSSFTFNGSRSEQQHANTPQAAKAVQAMLSAGRYLLASVHGASLNHLPIVSGRLSSSWVHAGDAFAMLPTGGHGTPRVSGGDDGATRGGGIVASAGQLRQFLRGLDKRHSASQPHSLDRSSSEAAGPQPPSLNVAASIVGGVGGSHAAAASSPNPVASRPPVANIKVTSSVTPPSTGDAVSQSPSARLFSRVRDLKDRVGDKLASLTPIATAFGMGSASAVGGDAPSNPPVASAAAPAAPLTAPPPQLPRIRGMGQPIPSPLKQQASATTATSKPSLTRVATDPNSIAPPVIMLSKSNTASSDGDDDQEVSAGVGLDLSGDENDEAAVSGGRIAIRKSSYNRSTGLEDVDADSPRVGTPVSGPSSIHWKDSHLYTQPFTQAASTMALHPAAPMYIRGGPGGTVAAMTLTCEPMQVQQPQQLSGAGAGERPHQYVHRLHSIYAYEPIPSAGALHAALTTGAVTGITSAAAGTRRPSLAGALFSHGPDATDGGAHRHSSLNPAAAATASTASQPPLHDGTGATAWDEQVTVVRWSQDGKKAIAGFASGIVRLWEAAVPEHPVAALALPPSSARHATSGLYSWSASEVLCLTASGTVLAVAGCPVFTDIKTAERIRSASAAANIKSVPGGGSTPVVSASGNAGPSSGFAFGIEAGGIVHAVVPVTLHDHTSSAAPSPGTAPMQCPSGYGINLFDLRVSNTPYATACPYPGQPGVTSLYHDEPSMSILAGCDDGSILLYDLRMNRVVSRVPGVPMLAAQSPVGGGTASGPHDNLAGGSKRMHSSGSAPHLLGAVSATAGGTGLNRTGSVTSMDSVDSPKPVHFPMDSFTGLVSTASTASDRSALAASASAGGGGSLSLSASASHSNMSASIEGFRPGAQVHMPPAHHTSITRSHFSSAFGGQPESATIDDAHVNCLDSFGHAGAVTVLAGHPSKRLVASGGQDGDVHLWSLPGLHHHVTLPRMHQPKHIDVVAMRPPSVGGGSGATSAPVHIPASQTGAPTGTGGSGIKPPIQAAPISAPASASSAVKAGVSSIVCTEDQIITGGYDGAIYAVPQRW